MQHKYRELYSFQVKDRLVMHIVHFVLGKFVGMDEWKFGERN